MCVGVSKAEPQTHATIVATLVLPPSGTGPLLVPSGFRTVTSTGTATKAATPTPTSVFSLPTGAGTSSTTASSTTATLFTTSSSTATATTSPVASDGQPQFSSAQIAGITLGCAAVLVFGILLVLLARCIRKRRFGDLEAGFSRMRDSMSFGKKSRPSSAPGGFQISSPLPRVQAERSPLDPRWHPQIPQGGVGLAITPMAARGGVFAKPSPALASLMSAPLPPTPAVDPVPAPAPTRAPAAGTIPKLVLSAPPESKAPAAERSPPKPALTLAIPKGQEPRVPVPANARDSVVTEFAEDGEGDMAPGTAIWRPPPTDPQSATTVYFADKTGNWILRNASTRQTEAEPLRRPPRPGRTAIQEVPAAPVGVELPSPDHKTRAERAKDAYGGFSPDAVVSPLRLPRKPDNGRLGSPIAFKDQRRELHISSPSLSARLSQTADTIQRQPPQARNQPSDAYPIMMREPRDLTGGKSKRRSSRRASRRVSEGSVTSIESAAEDEDVVADEAQADLSPVVESPHTPISPGKSPVTYPKIHKRADRQQAAAFSKAPEPDLLPSAHKYNVWHPPGRSSPTGSSSLSKTGAIPPSNGPRRPWNAPNLNPAPNRNPGQARTGSPETRLAPVSPPIDSQYWQRQRQLGNPASYWNQSQKQPPARPRPPPPPTPPYELPGNNMSPPSSRRYQTPPPPQQQQQQQRRPAQQQLLHQHQQPNPAFFFLPTPAATPQQPATAPRQPSQQPHRQPQPQPAATPPPAATARHTTSSQSSLLAKRRGADKAAALSLASSNSGNEMRGTSGGSNARNGRRQQGGSGWKREEVATTAGSPYGPVPITPGWVPELTPTRRGEDLVLNVR